MTWAQFQKRRLLYHRAWQALKDELDGEVRKYLDRSTLAIDYGKGCFEYRIDDLLSLAVEHPDFFVKDKKGFELLAIAKEYIDAKDKDPKAKNTAIRKAEKFDTKHLYISDNNGEVRFPGLRIDFIQKIKQSRHVDHGMTDMSKASIRVVLKID